MSNSSKAKTRLSFLGKILVTAFSAGLLAIVFSAVGICQTPGYGDKPDQWAPYESGQYFEQLQRIMSTYQASDTKIAYLHFEFPDVGIGPVELFRIPLPRRWDCTENDCDLFVLVASDHSDAPILTFCQFKQAALTHLFNPDGSNFFGFEFSCPETLLQVKVTSTHFMAMPLEKKR
jgi:hypothetical protein